MAVGQIYQLVSTYIWHAPTNGGADEECTNVYWYRHASGATPLAAGLVAAAWSSGVFLPLQALAPEHIEFIRTQVVNYANPVDYFDDDYSVDGLRAIAGNDPVSPVNNVSFKSPRAFPGTRPARKRYPFLFEADTIGKNIVGTLLISAAVANIEAALAATITNSGNGFEPVVIDRRTSDPVLGVNPPVRYAPVGNWSAEQAIASQDTRKR